MLFSLYDLVGSCELLLAVGLELDLLLLLRLEIRDHLVHHRLDLGEGVERDLGGKKARTRRSLSFGIGNERAADEAKGFSEP
jgi:hypothetical protein